MVSCRLFCIHKTFGTNPCVCFCIQPFFVITISSVMLCSLSYAIISFSSAQRMFIIQKWAIRIIFKLDYMYTVLQRNFRQNNLLSVYVFLQNTFVLHKHKAYFIEYQNKNKTRQKFPLHNLSLVERSTYIIKIFNILPKHYVIGL